jgi:hypothetical protein
MPLLHYNPTSTNVKAVTLLSTKERSNPTPLQSESKSYEDLEKIPQKWMLVLEILYHYIWS